MFTLLASAGFVITFSILAIIAIAILIEVEKEGWATSVFSLAMALFLWNYRAEVWDFVSQNPKGTFGFAISYVVGGVLWSIIKWRTYIKPIFTRFSDAKDAFKAEHGAIKDNWEQWVKDLRAIKGSFQLKDSYYTPSFEKEDTAEDIVRKITPFASKKKTLITSWIAYWPMSLAATMLNNPFRRFFEWIYSLVSGIYDRIAGGLAKNAMKGLES